MVMGDHKKAKNRYWKPLEILETLETRKRKARDVISGIMDIRPWLVLYWRRFIYDNTRLWYIKQKELAETLN